jgi:hypothetical protein
MRSLEDIDWTDYDFVDLGCSSGGSIEHCMKRFGAERGLGVDLDPAKVERTQAAGYDAVVADAQELDLDRQVSFITMLDFFEHLPDLGVVEEILAAAHRSARDFIYIKHPSFEGEEQFEAQGLRQYWWDWHGHTCHVRVADYCSMFDRLGISSYTIRYLGRIDGSDHPSIVPVSAPADLSANEAAAVVDVPDLRFSPPLWRRQDIFIALRPFEPDEWTDIVRPTPQDLKLMRESGQLPGESADYPHLAPNRRPDRRVAPGARLTGG